MFEQNPRIALVGKQAAAREVDEDGASERDKGRVSENDAGGDTEPARPGVDGVPKRFPAVPELPANGWIAPCL